MRAAGFKDDGPAHELLEAGHLAGNFVRTGLQKREDIKAARIGRGELGDAGAGVLRRDSGSGDYGFGSVGYGTRELRLGLTVKKAAAEQGDQADSCYVAVSTHGRGSLNRNHDSTLCANLLKTERCSQPAAPYRYPLFIRARLSTFPGPNPTSKRLRF